MNPAPLHDGPTWRRHIGPFWIEDSKAAFTAGVAILLIAAFVLFEGITHLPCAP